VRQVAWAELEVGAVEVDATELDRLAALVLVTMLGGMATPSDPASTFAATWGLMLLIVGFAWGTGNRISAATLETREHVLRLESRLADLSERLAK